MKQHILENGESNGENTTLGIQDLGDSISGYGVIKDDIEKIMGNNKDDFKFYSNDLLQKLGVEGTKQGFFVNIKQRKVISEKGLKYKNKMYYTLDELPDGFYNVEYEDKNTESPQIGNIETMSLDANSWKFIVSDIKYGGYVNKGQVFYKKDGAENWEKTENDYFVVSEPGKYDVKVVDVAGNESETKKAYAYAKNGLILYYDGINNTKKGHDANTTTWEDLSGNNNDGTLYNFKNNSESGWTNNGIVCNGEDNYIKTKDVNFENNYSITVDLTFEENKYVKRSGSNHVILMGILDNDDIAWKRFTMHTWENENNEEKILDGRMFIGGNFYDGKEKNRFSPGEMKGYKTKEGKRDNIIYTYDGSTMNAQLYINSILIAEKQYIAKPYKIQYFKTGTGNYKTYNTIRIYNRALNEEEIKANYKIDKERFNITE